MIRHLDDSKQVDGYRSDGVDVYKSAAARGAIRWARRLLDGDEVNEAACRRLMRLYALSGDRARALRVYHGCATALVREVGVAPSAATREAYERLIEPEAPRAPQESTDTPWGPQPPDGRLKGPCRFPTAGVWNRARHRPRSPSPCA
jgi:hypothetical protein